MVQDIFLTKTAEYADVVFPAAADWCEADGTVTNSERRVQRTRKAIDPPGQAWPDLKIISELAKRMGHDWGDPTAEQAWDELRSLSAMHAGMSYPRDTPLTFEGTREIGASLGSGVIMLFDDQVDLVDILTRVAAFFRDESCGQCVPCRVGTVRQEEALARLGSGRSNGSAAADVELLGKLCLVMKDASICGLGQTAPAALQSALALNLLGVGASDAADTSRTPESLDRRQAEDPLPT